MRSSLRTIFAPAHTVARLVVAVYGMGVKTVPGTAGVAEAACWLKCVLYAVLAAAIPISLLTQDTPQEARRLDAVALLMLSTWVCTCLALGHYSAALYFRRRRTQQR